jgi:hypothetical protein
MSDEQIKEAAVYNANRYKEGVILENGRPSLASYLTLMKSFAKANKFELEITRNHTNANNGNHVLIAQFKLGAKFSLYKLETYKLLLEEFADVGKVDSTETMVYMEFKPRNDQTLKDPVKE